jgi:serine/threonine protein kinase
MGGALVQVTVRPGALLYSSPERFGMTQHVEYGVETDIWSVGITLCELGMLQFPYDLGDRGPDGAINVFAARFERMLPSLASVMGYLPGDVPCTAMAPPVGSLSCCAMWSLSRELRSLLSR